jgi:hypothetical protein
LNIDYTFAHRHLSIARMPLSTKGLFTEVETELQTAQFAQRTELKSVDATPSTETLLGRGA